jgi:hypothetical protein
MRLFVAEKAVELRVGLRDWLVPNYPVQSQADLP